MYEYDNINTDPEWKRVTMALKCLRKMIKMHDVVVDSLGRDWAFKYVLRCVKHILSYIDTRITRRKDIDVKELVALCEAEEMLTTEMLNAVGVKLTNSLGHRVMLTQTAAKTLTKKLPQGLAQSATALEEKLHFMKEHASTRAYSEKSKKAPPVIRRSQRILKNKLRQNRTTKLLVSTQEQKLPLLTLNDNENFSDNDEEEDDSLENIDSAICRGGNADENEYAFVENVDIDEMDDEELLERFTFRKK